jgi:lipooligosaccharide transport system permease protein
VSTPMMLRVVEREARVYKKLFRGLAFTTLGQPVLYLAAMGLGLGGLVDAHSGPIDGLDYLDFVAPGLMVASAMQLAATESLWPVLAGVKWMRFYYGVVATPIGPRDLYGGYVLWVGLRALFAAAAFLLVAALLGAVPSAWGVLAIPACGLTAAAFCAPLCAFSISQDTDLSFPMIMRLGVLPLFLFSGTFFPIEQLPTGLQFLAVFSPLWHGVELARHATTGNLEPWADLFHVAFLSLCVAIGAWFGVRGYEKRLNA